MSVIIRLQNLPWSANALDIRQYFRGLSIPEGGVHIVGGEQGDAFIAFSTDEDARQAMMLDGGKIKEVKIKLLLSSRAEMQKVIELARQQSLTLQNFMQLPVLTAPAPTAAAPAPAPAAVIPPPTVATTIPEVVVVAAPERRDSRDDKKDADKKERDRRTRSRSRDGDRRDRKDRDRDRHRDRDRDRDRRRRDRSRSRDRRRRDRRDRSRSRERSRSRDKDRDSKRSSRDNKRDSLPPVSEEEKAKEQNGDVIPVAQTTKIVDSSSVKSWDISTNPLINNGVRPAARPLQGSIEPEGRRALFPTAGDTIRASLNDNFMPMRGRESWPPSGRQPTEVSTRFPRAGYVAPGYGNNNNNNNEGDEYDTHGEMEMRSNFRGSFRGGMSDFRRGGFASRDSRMGGIAGDSRMGGIAGDIRMGGIAGDSRMGSIAGDSRMAGIAGDNRMASIAGDRMGGLAGDRMGAIVGDRMGGIVGDRMGAIVGDRMGGIGGDRMGGIGGDSRMGGIGGASIMDRLSANEMEDRRGTGSFAADRRNQYRGEQEFSRNDRFMDQFGRDPPGQFLVRPGTFPTERFSRERYSAPAERNFEQRTPVVGTAVEIRNMPIETGYGDIRRFFQGIYISGNGLKLINDNHGNRVGIAYVKFQKREDKEDALKYNGKTIRGSIVEVLHLSDEIFEKAIDSYKPPEKEPEEEPQDKKESLYDCLCFKDLPPYAKEADFLKMFPDIVMEEIIISHHKDDKKQLLAYIKFSNHEDAKKAIYSKTKHTLGHKTVSVAPCSFEEMQDAKIRINGIAEPEPVVVKPVPEAKEVSQAIKSPEDPRDKKNTPATESTVPEQTKVSSIDTDCVLLKNLPVDANDRDILDFFSDVGLVPLRIHIMLDKFGKPTGDAFCEFSDTEEAERSCTKHNMPLGKQEVSVQAVLRTEMNEALGIGPPHDAPVQPLGMGRMQHPRDFGNRSMGLLGISPQGPILGRMPLLGRHPGSIQPQVSPVEGFGKPGCVIALENIPFRSDIDEILEFFSDYDISRENVIRRFNDKGMATGDARVAFNNPSEAQRAVRELRFRKIRGRPIYLSML